MSLPGSIIPSHPCSLHSTTETLGVFPATPPPSLGSFPSSSGPSSLLLDPAHPPRPVSGPASCRTHSGPGNGYTSPLSPTLPFTRPRLTLTGQGMWSQEPGTAGSRSDPLHTACETWGRGSLSECWFPLSVENNPTVGCGDDKVRFCW